MPPPQFYSRLKNATQCALDAIQLMGGNGYVNDNPVGRYLRDAKLAEIGAGTSEIRRMLIGRELFNEDRFSGGAVFPTHQYLTSQAPCRWQE